MSAGSVLPPEPEYIRISNHLEDAVNAMVASVPLGWPRNLPPPKERNLGITQRLALQRIESEKRRHDDRRGYSRPVASDRGHHNNSKDQRDQRSFSSFNRTGRVSPRRSYSNFPAPTRTPRGINSRSGDDIGQERELSSGKLVSRGGDLNPPIAKRLSGGRIPALERLSVSTTRRDPKRKASLTFEDDNSGDDTTLKSLRSSRNRIPAEERLLEDDAQRIPATLRLSDPPEPTRSVRITIPQSPLKAGGKRRLTKSEANKRVPRSPLQSVKLKKVALSKTVKPARKRLCSERNSLLPCDKAGTSLPKSTTTREARKIGSPIPTAILLTNNSRGTNGKTKGGRSLILLGRLVIRSKCLSFRLNRSFR
ncbi:hypothetical protein Bca4012_062717 [Brassica carinata]